MRVLIVRPGPSFSVQDVSRGWVRGLTELGCTVGDFNFDDRLDFYCSAQIDNGEGDLRFAFSRPAAYALAGKGVLAACYEFWPDVVVIVSGFFVAVELVDLIRSRGHFVVGVFTESPYEDDRQLEYAQHVDLALLNDPTNLEAFRAVQPETYYVPHAYDPERHHPGKAVPEMVCDFAFVGTGFPSRREFFEAVDLDGLDVILGGSWSALDESSPLAPLVAHRRDWCMDNAETADLYRSTRTSLNLYRREYGHDGYRDLKLPMRFDDRLGLARSEGWSIGPREVELAACQCFFLRDPRPEGDQLFPMLPTFTEPGEVRELLDWWLAHEASRELVAAQAREVIASRTFVANARWLLQHTERD